MGDLKTFLYEVMRRRGVRPSHLAAKLGISHATVSRWLSGHDVPSIKSCHKLARYSDVPVYEVLNIAGHLPMTYETERAELPAFREYARQKYSAELDDDLITMIEDLIERRRQRAKNDGRNMAGN